MQSGGQLSGRSHVKDYLKASPRYHVRTSSFSQQRKSVWALSQPAALPGSAFTDQAQSASTEFRRTVDAQHMGFSVAESPHKLGILRPYFIFCPIRTKRQNLDRSRNKASWDQRSHVFLVSSRRLQLLKSSRLCFLKSNLMWCWVQVRTWTPTELSLFNWGDSLNSRTHILEGTVLEPGK